MTCRWNNKIQQPWEGRCPFMYHTLYPYFLGLMYGAKFDYNEMGDCQVGCPGKNGVDTIVRKRASDGCAGVPEHWREVIYAEVMKVGYCPFGYQTGDKIMFPLYEKDKKVCPSLLDTAFPILIAVEGLELPSCIDPNHIRCTDWMEDEFYSSLPNPITVPELGI